MSPFLNSNYASLFLSSLVLIFSYFDVGFLNPFFLFCLYFLCASVWVFAYVYVCSPHVCSAYRWQKRHKKPWNWSCRQLWPPYGCWEPNLTSLQEQLILLSTEPSLQYQPYGFKQPTLCFAECLKTKNTWKLTNIILLNNQQLSEEVRDEGIKTSYEQLKIKTKCSRVCGIQWGALKIKTLVINTYI